MEFRWYPLCEFAQEHAQEWRRLGEQALSPNIYLMPEFVLPGARHLLDDGTQVVVAAVRNASSQLSAMALFTVKQASWRYPFRRLVSFHTRHSFQSGVLVAPGSARAAMTSLLRGITDRYGAIQFDELRTDTATFRLLSEVSQDLGTDWVWEKSYQRAMLSDPGTGWSSISSKRQKSIRRNWSKLRQMGSVEFVVKRNREITDTDIEDFIRVESSGWKDSSALGGNPANTRFFREMIDATRRAGYPLFTQLKVNGEPVAATSNFAIAEHVFAFKIGIDPGYTKLGPGILAETAFLRWCAEHGLRYTSFDSGAQANSYIDALWPDRSTIASGTLLRGSLNKAAFRAKTRIKFAHRDRASSEVGVS